jgi:hypothetical protein
LRRSLGGACQLVSFRVYPDNGSVFRSTGRATEKTMDLRWRGGTVVISRLIVPSITCPAAYVMASMCQFGRYTSPGDTRRVHLCQRLRSSARKGKLFRSCRREDRARFRRSGRSDTNVRLHPAAGCANPAIRPMTGYGTLGAPRTHLRPLQPRAQPLFRWWMGKKTISVHPYWQRIKRRHQVAPGVGAF